MNQPDFTWTVTDFNAVRIALAVLLGLVLLFWFLFRKKD